MCNVLVLGSTGMLGSSIKFELKQSEYDVFYTTRKRNSRSDSHEYLFDFTKDNLRTWFDHKPRFEYVINCIGAIPQKYVGKPEVQLREMIELNSLLPQFLNEQSGLRGFRTIQIATDCVFSGKRGNYSEKSVPDETDIYGVTKSLGENYSPNAMHLRCSIIGKEDPSNSSLHNWLLACKKNSEVNGFRNHQWNGITTVAFAKIVRGIIQKQLFVPGKQHILPSDRVSKYQLLQIIALASGRNDLQILPTEHEMTIDRTLSSVFPAINDLLWAAGGYAAIPSISELVAELETQGEGLLERK
jgi:dTDP-4-dehydrorhamnose reductase